MENRRVHGCEGMLANIRCSVFSHRQVHQNVKIFCLFFHPLSYITRPDIHLCRPFCYVLTMQFTHHKLSRPPSTGNKL